MSQLRQRMGWLSILLILPLLFPALGFGAAPAPIPVQVQLSAPTSPSAAQTGDAERIQFAPGATSATVEGSLTPNSANQYVLQVSAGQTLAVQITTTQGQVVLTIMGADGTLLVTDYAANSTFSSVVPTTQDYIVDVQATGQAPGQYALQISVPAAGAGTPPPAGAQRIQFAPGATSATVQGNLAANGSQQYVVRVQAGQLLQAEVTQQQDVQQQDIQMSVQGADGRVLKGIQGNAFFRGDVPTTQDYIVTLTTGSTAMPYILTVAIPVRISFAAGATSATVQGSMPTSSIRQYVIQASAGQTMTIQTSTTQGQVIVIVYGVDGTVLQSDHATSGKFSGTLPFTEDYLIDVESGPQSAAQFSMTVTIPPSGSSMPHRILFASGATSATVQGNLPANGSQKYVVRVQAGQLLQVDVAPQQDVQVSVQGADGTLLKGNGSGAFFRGDVPTTQDYIVTLTGGDEAFSYSLTVTVPVRVSFAKGATSAKVQGNLAPNTIGHYVLKASAGQTLAIKTMALQGQVVIVVYGADGTVLQSDHVGANSFSGTLPSTQDYLIDVVPVGQAAAYFSMTVTIPAP
jgi:hypothetical protein